MSRCAAQPWAGRAAHRTEVRLQGRGGRPPPAWQGREQLHSGRGPREHHGAPLTVRLSGNPGPTMSHSATQPGRGAELVQPRFAHKRQGPAKSNKTLNCRRTHHTRGLPPQPRFYSNPNSWGFLQHLQETKVGLFNGVTRSPSARP